MINKIKLYKLINIKIFILDLLLVLYLKNNKFLLYKENIN